MSTLPDSDSELFRLIRSFRAALDAGDRAQALRNIDRAYRRAPQSPEINHLYGRLVLADGLFEDAVRHFKDAAENLANPEFEAAYIVALCAGGELTAAQGRLERALARFAAAADGALARAARRVAEETGRPGWIGMAPDMALHGEIVARTGPVRLKIARPELDSSFFLRIDCNDGANHTQFSLPPRKVPKLGRLLVSLEDEPLLGGDLSMPPDFGLDGRVTMADGTISGWATFRWDPDRTLDLSISGRNGFSLDVATTPDPHQIGRHLFALDPEIWDGHGNIIHFKVKLPNGRRGLLPGSPLLIQPKAARRLHRKALHPLEAADSGRKVDIVIPVYSGVEETAACIRSVMATVGDDAEIIVIEDASPDAAMVPMLQDLAQSGAITLLHNPRNLGFPKSANRGLKLHGDRDVVLLNADTEVYGNWLTRLRAAAYGDSKVGTVTPLTNSGSIASYPAASDEPELTGETVAERDRLAARINAGTTVEIPTGVGFCLYFRRDCLDEVGTFDTVTFGRGYGEENDFCLRATRAGWRHLLATDIYVRHLGTRSFGADRPALYDRNLRLLNLRYPGYDADIQAFLKVDPAHPARRRLDEARLVAAWDRHVLIVTLPLEGGVRRAVGDRVRELRDAGLIPIVLKPDSGESTHCSLTIEGSGLDDLHYRFADEIPALFSLLRKLRLDHIELHHFLGLPGKLIDGLYRMRWSIDIQVHDYIWYCPRITLLDGAGRYCGEPDLAACESCVDKNGSRLGEDMSVAALRERSRRWLRAARHVVVASPSVAKRMTAQFPDIALKIEPLEPPVPVAAIAPSVRKKIKVALIGAIGDHKGYDVLLEMARDTVQRGLPIEFVVIGYTKDDIALFDTGVVFVTGEYEEGEIDGLLAREKPDLALFLSQFPETWSYALTHALRAGIPVAAFDLGAIADRLRAGSDDPLLLPLAASPRELCDRLLGAFRLVPGRDAQSTPDVTNIRQDAKWLPARPTIVFNRPAPFGATKISRIDMAQQSTAFSAAVEVLPLTKGLYVFSVRSAYAQPVRQKGLKLPALQVGLGPGAPPAQLELMLGPQMTSSWLCDPQDQIIVKVGDAPATIMLTSVVPTGMKPLELEIRRLDSGPAPVQAPAAAPGAPVRIMQAPVARSAPPLPQAQRPVHLKVTAHVQMRGDIQFSESQWIGLVGQRLWIESFAIVPLEGIPSDAIEYKAITATGVETPWVDGGSSCGTRGIGVPLIGFAIRGKFQQGGPQLTCEYGAILLSGAKIGPSRNGAPCRSPDPGDPIEGIWVSIDAGAEAVPEPKPAEVKTGGKPARKRKVDSEESSAEPQAAAVGSSKPRAPIGPRFSVFREPDQAGEE